MRSVYRSFTESIDEVFFGPSMLDVMIGRLTRQAAETAGLVGPAATDEDRVEQALRAKAAPEQEPADTLSHLSGDLTTLAGEPSTSPFAAPICDLVLAVFELDRRDNWLRRQAIVIILQQVFGDTVERYVTFILRPGSCCSNNQCLLFLSAGKFARVSRHILMNHMCSLTSISSRMECGLMDV